METLADQPHRGEVVKSITSHNRMKSTAAADVLVFVPGLGPADGMEPSHVAHVLCWEMDQRAADKSAALPCGPHQLMQISFTGSSKQITQ
jgi:hypothetical protein